MEPAVGGVGRHVGDEAAGYDGAPGHRGAVVGHVERGGRRGDGRVMAEDQGARPVFDAADRGLLGQVAPPGRVVGGEAPADDGVLPDVGPLAQALLGDDAVLARGIAAHEVGRRAEPAGGLVQPRAQLLLVREGGALQRALLPERDLREPVAAVEHAGLVHGGRHVPAGEVDGRERAQLGEGKVAEEEVGDVSAGRHVQPAAVEAGEGMERVLELLLLGVGTGGAVVVVGPGLVGTEPCPIVKPAVVLVEDVHAAEPGAHRRWRETARGHDAVNGTRREHAEPGRLGAVHIGIVLGVAGIADRVVPGSDVLLGRAHGDLLLGSGAGADPHLARRGVVGPPGVVVVREEAALAGDPGVGDLRAEGVAARRVAAGQVRRGVEPGVREVGGRRSRARRLGVRAPHAGVRAAFGH